MFLKEFPAPDLGAQDLAAYFEREADTWALVHGLRYAAIAGMVVFFGALHARVASGPKGAAAGWATIGLVGGVLHVASLFITNGIELFAFSDGAYMAAHPDAFWLVFQMTRVLFTAEIAAWAVLAFGFSIAGWVSGGLPKLIALLGFATAALCMASSVFIVSILQDGWAVALIQFGELAMLAWFFSIGVFMLLRGGG
ncbi:hypothetical protein ACFOOP_06570 [Marinicaulis aureus]|uniref:DUF4386 domain-containing protein n=1 Tax=Hyphococcus aureus TaxID=2666033 RepID=A0ABW1KRJ8_9PROT